MKPHIDERAPSRPQGRSARGVLLRIYTGNPFYVLSADLVFVGLRMSFDTHGETFEVGALMGALLGYTLLLAATAWALIRLGRVWDDARTLLLLVVAMFLAISMTFDETLASSPGLGISCYAGGLLFAVAVSEGLLRGVGLRLPALYRIPYYLILLLFFAYPVALTPLLRDPDGPALRWALFGFSTAAGLAFLALIPAIRRGPGYASKNGSPWRHPLYPWCLFGLLAAVVCARAFYVCISLHFVSLSHFSGRSDNIFAPYFLVPFLLALVVLLIEAGLVSRSRTVLRASMAILPAIAWLAVVGYKPDPVFRGFLALFMDTTGGSPLFMTLLAIAGVYGLAAVRGVPHAFSWLSGTLLVLTVVGPRSLELGDWVRPQPVPLLALAMLQAWLGLRRRASWRCALGVGLAAAAAIAWDPDAIAAPGVRAFAAIHLVLLAAALIGAIFDDPFARFLRQGVAAALVIACVAAHVGAGRIANVPEGFGSWYPLLVIASCVAWGLLTDSGVYLVAASVGLAGLLAILGCRIYLEMRRALAGLDWIVLGLGFFAVAARISLGKVWAARAWLAGSGVDELDESLDAG